MEPIPKEEVKQNTNPPVIDNANNDHQRSNNDNRCRGSIGDEVDRGRPSR